MSGERVELDASAPTLVTRMAEDDEGAVWFGTDTDGLHRLREGSVLTIGTGQGLSSRLGDHARRRRRAAGRGRRRARPARAAGATRVELGIDASDPLEGILMDSTGTLWVGADTRGLLRRRDGHDTWFGPAEGLRTVVRVIHEAPGGQIYLGARDGVYRIDGDRAALVSATPDMVNALGTAPDGSLWVGSVEGVARVDGGGALAPIPLPGAPPKADVTSLLFDPDGTTWVGTNGAGRRSASSSCACRRSCPA